MSASTALSLTGSTTRARFLSEPSLPSGPRNSSGWLSLTWQQPPHCHYTCFSQAPNSKSSAFAVRKGSDDGFFSNTEDSDEILDEMFEKHGKVVFTRNENTSPTAEVDDDAECLSFAVALAKVASDVKAAEVKLLFVKPLVYWTRFFIIATAFSFPQIDAIGSKMRDLAEDKYGRVPAGDSKPTAWTLLDFGDVVIHIFLPPQRAFYNLEEFYANATPIELPFNNQPPARN